MAPEPSTETTEASFDPRKRPSPRRAVGGPPPRQLPIEGAGGEGSAAVTGEPVPMALVAVPVGEGIGEDTADGGRLPGRQRRPGSREIHVTLSEKAYRLLEAARAENPGISYGDLIASALVGAKPTLLADRPVPPDDPLLRPARARAAARRRSHSIPTVQCHAGAGRRHPGPGRRGRDSQPFRTRRPVSRPHLRHRLRRGLNFAAGATGRTATARSPARSTPASPSRPDHAVPVPHRALRSALRRDGTGLLGSRISTRALSKGDHPWSVPRRQERP